MRLDVRCLWHAVSPRTRWGTSLRRPLPKCDLPPGDVPAAMLVQRSGTCPLFLDRLEVEDFAPCGPGTCHAAANSQGGICPRERGVVSLSDRSPKDFSEARKWSGSFTERPAWTLAVFEQKRRKPRRNKKNYETPRRANPMVFLGFSRWSSLTR